MYDKIWVFDIESAKWTQAKGSFQEIFRIRPKVSLCSIGNDLYFFGGQSFPDKGEPVYLNDFYVLRGNWSTMHFTA